MAITIINKPSNKEISQRKLETYDKYSQVIQWGRAYPIEFASRFMGIELLDMQKYAIYNSWTKDFVLWLKSRNAGKGNTLDTKLPTPDGSYILMGNIRVGDKILSAEGTPTIVTAISPIHNKPCYEIQFDDNEKLIVDEDHLWDVNYDCKTLDEYGFKTKSTKDIAKDYVRYRKDNGYPEYKYKVPMSKPIQYQHKDLLIHPYILGLWLGDGSSKNSYVTSHIDDYQELCQHIKNVGYKITSIRNDKDTKKTITIADGNNVPLITLIKKLGLYNNKQIPKEYLFSSVNQRNELLKGLMDTDGSCDKLGRCEFSQKSESFMKDFSFLLDSLAIKNTISYRFGTAISGSDKLFDSWRCYFIVDKHNSCFKFERKNGRLKNKIKKSHNTKTITSIKEIPSVPTQCIMVDNQRHLYLCGERFTVTHNTTELAIYTMLRSALFPFHVTYFLGNTGDQAKETYKKVEKITKKEIESFTGCTDIFFNELKKSGVNSDGFVHNPASFTCSLFNGSEINTLNSDVTNIKGKRANLVNYCRL